MSIVSLISGFVILIYAIGALILGGIVVLAIVLYRRSKSGGGRKMKTGKKKDLRA
jgi:hypothetical protein